MAFKGDDYVWCIGKRWLINLHRYTFKTWLGCHSLGQYLIQTEFHWTEPQIFSLGKCYWNVREHGRLWWLAVKQNWPFHDVVRVAIKNNWFNRNSVGRVQYPYEWILRGHRVPTWVHRNENKLIKRISQYRLGTNLINQNCAHNYRAHIHTHIPAAQ